MVASTASASATVARRAWINAGLAAWLIVGVCLVTRATNLGLIADPSFSIYHVPAYVGLAALAIYIVTAVGAEVRHRRPWRAAFDGGYEFLPLGFAILLGYTAVDVAWRAWFGERIGIEGALAPSRLLLAVGFALVAAGPVRAVLVDPRAPRLAGAIAVAMIVQIGVFPLGRLHTLVGDYAERPANATEDDSEIWVMAADGSHQTRVIPAGDGIEVSLPTWSPDGKRIAFTRWAHTAGGATEGDIWIADADGGNARALTSGPGTEWIPTWTPDGAWIAYTADPKPATAPAGGTTIAVGPQPGEAPGVGSPRSTAGQMWLVRPDGSERHKATDTTGGVFGATWSSDGRRITYDSDRTGDFKVYVAHPDGSGELRLTDGPGDDWGSPSWSPDGTRIAFTSNRTGDNEVWVIGADGTGLTRLTDDPADDSVPAWSPDGSRIVFASDRTGDVEVWSMAPDGSDQRNVTQRPSADDGHWSASWSPDGRALVFASAGLGPAVTQPIVLEDLAVAGAFLIAVAFAMGAIGAVSMGLPFGAVTILLAVDASLAAFISDDWRFVPVLIGAGLLIDLVLRRLDPSRRAPMAAILTPVAITLGYGATLLVAGSLAWSTTLLLGTVIASGLIGWVIGTLLLRSEPA